MDELFWVDCGEVVGTRVTTRPHQAVSHIPSADAAEIGAPLVSRFDVPSQDLGELLGRIGCKLFTRDHTLVQFLAWSEMSGLFRVMEEQGTVAINDVCAHTALNENGADALLGVLCALGLATRSAPDRFALTRGAREYFLPTSPFYIGDQLRKRVNDVPRAYVVDRDGLLFRLRISMLGLLPSIRFGSRVRLRNQHARNLPSCAAAVRTGEFSKVRSIVDIAGGSGTFSIPLALETSVERIVLAELPQALPNIRPYLARHGLEKRVELFGFDVFSFPWQLPTCDGIFVGNFLHGFTDEVCRRICSEAYMCLSQGGKIWVHELLWNENKDGPLITAITHADMRSGGSGRQRTARELSGLLMDVGFTTPYVVPTAGAYALVAARKL